MEIFLTLGILVLAFVAFVFEWLPVDLTALCVAIVLMFVGLVTPEEGISGFSNSATITVMAMFILSAGVTRTGVLEIVRDWLIIWGGKNPTRQIFVLGIIIGPISAFINNTAVVAIFIPIVEEWCKKQGISVSKLLIPLSYVTVLAGMITLVGTSTNIVASGVSKDLGYGEFGLFQFTALGVITFSVGLIYLAFAAPHLLPNRRSPENQLLDQGYQLKEYLSEVIITPRSSLIGQTLAQSSLQRKFDFDVLELIRNDVHLPQPLGDRVFNAGDILLVYCTRDDLLKIKEEKGLELFPNIQFQEDDLTSTLSSGEEGLAEVLILSNSRLVGTTLKDIRFRQRYNSTVLAIRRGSELLKGRLGKIPLRFGDLLLVQGPKQSLVGLQTTRELLVLEQKEPELLRKDKAWVALAIIFGVIVAAAFEWVPILQGSLAGIILMVITGCLRPGEVYGSVRWDIIFMLAGLIPLGIAMDNSGATAWLADGLVAIGGNLSGYALLTFFYLVTSIMTEILSNNAAVILMIPVAVNVANTLGLNPLAFMFAVTFAASNSYMTPIGYQTNTMVYTPGSYKFLDFTRVGAPLNLILTILTPLLIIWMYGL
ncbi:SLC13 family permease [Gloeocapsa sp. PCC 73106]|uniref:SLC13 family permease n=1 Tax=Gloeocapsa sp. PCC 73106 TaxID=102232 RepID=UPI0002AC9DBE|nr:SLC13 family permease [Gloeocapsa sp. PCC 73106]ELR99904.1 di-/tricarboxylate transporter [Gloeocapsa sp. PCC 73106]